MTKDIFSAVSDKITWRIPTGIPDMFAKGIHRWFSEENNRRIYKEIHERFSKKNVWKNLWKENLREIWKNIKKNLKVIIGKKWKGILWKISEGIRWRFAETGKDFMESFLMELLEKCLNKSQGKFLMISFKKFFKLFLGSICGAVPGGISN